MKTTQQIFASATAALVIGSAIAVVPAQAQPAPQKTAAFGAIRVAVNGLPRGAKAAVHIGCNSDKYSRSVAGTTSLTKVPVSRCWADYDSVQTKYRKFVTSSRSQEFNVAAGRWSLASVTYVPVKAGVNLAGASFWNTGIDGYDLRRTNLSSILVTYSAITRSNLAQANLSGAYCVECLISRSNLRYANLSNAQLMADLRDDDFTGARLLGIRLTGAETGFTGMIDKSTFNRADFSGAYLNAEFSHVSFVGANLSNVRTAYTSFDAVDFTGANFTDADFSSARFSNVTASRIIGNPRSLPAGWQLVDGTLVRTIPSAPSALR